jgi:hypothetical protein
MKGFRRAILGITIALVAGMARANEVAADFDWWRYIPGHFGRGPSATLITWPNGEFNNRPHLAFRVTCDAKRHELLIEYFPGENPLKWIPEARDGGLEIILEDTPNADKPKIYTVHGPVTSRSMTGRLKLTPKIAGEIIEAPVIELYGENGPSNNFYGGKALALRRVVRECAG